MANAVEKVSRRLLRAVRALEQANIPYAVTGDGAVAAWVSRVDEAAVRNTQDVDIVLRRTELLAARGALDGRALFTGMWPALTCFSTGRTRTRGTRFTLFSPRKKSAWVCAT